MKHICSNHWPDYELIDAGNNKKLERWGTIITIRPDRNAYFKPVMHYQNWIKKAHYEFVEFTHNSGEWNSLKNNFPVYKNDQMASWKISYKNCTFNLKLTKFKHIGLFPEQQNNWDFIAQNVKKNAKILNLFAYTGAASLIANEKGANVYHCDSIKQVLSWAKNNIQKLESEMNSDTTSKDNIIDANNDLDSFIDEKETLVTKKLEFAKTLTTILLWGICSRTVVSRLKSSNNTSP